MLFSIGLVLFAAAPSASAASVLAQLEPVWMNPLPAPEPAKLNGCVEASCVATADGLRVCRCKTKGDDEPGAELELVLLLDREHVRSFTVRPPPGRKDFTRVDEHLKFRLAVTAGPHDLGVTFLKEPSSLVETLRQPYNSHFNTHRHPRLSPAVYQVSITGPFADRGPGDTPSRRRIFATRPKSPADEEACAKQILTALPRRAYRRPAGDGLGYAVFGHVVQGMDVVNRILNSPTSPTEGEGVMRGQMLSPRVRIITARRVP